MVHISSEIEINRPPADVRAIVLDFPNWPQWLKTGLLLRPLDTTKPGTALRRGDKLHSDFEGIVVKPVVVENTPATFQWRGSFHGLIKGHHSVFFKDSEKTPGGTTLVHSEEVKGVLAFMFRRKAKQGKVTQEAIRGFNRDLKARAEAL